MAVAHPISIRLDEDVRTVLDADAQRHGIGLATYLRDLAARQAKMLRKAAIRDESRLVGERVEGDAEGREFYQFWGTPSPKI